MIVGTGLLIVLATSQALLVPMPAPMAVVACWPTMATTGSPSERDGMNNRSLRPNCSTTSCGVTQPGSVIRSCSPWEAISRSTSYCTPVRQRKQQIGPQMRPSLPFS